MVGRREGNHIESRNDKMIEHHRWADTKAISVWWAEADRRLTAGIVDCRPPITHPFSVRSMTFCARIVICCIDRGAPAAAADTCTTTPTPRPPAVTWRTGRIPAEPVRPAAITPECRPRRSAAWNDWHPPSARKTTRAASTSGCTISHRWPAIRNSPAPATTIITPRHRRPCLYCRTCPAVRASYWRIWRPAPTMRLPCTFSHEASTEPGRTVPRAICRRADHPLNLGFYIYHIFFISFNYHLQKNKTNNIIHSISFDHILEQSNERDCGCRRIVTLSLHPKHFKYVSYVSVCFHTNSPVNWGQITIDTECQQYQKYRWKPGHVSNLERHQRSKFLPKNETMVIENGGGPVTAQKPPFYP